MSAIEGHVPTAMIRTFSAYIDFCYIVRRNVITEDTLDELDDALARFHLNREIFKETNVRKDTVRGKAFSLPRQHSMVHYRAHIENFGAPNGLCSSITESKHIVAVKRTWRRTSRCDALRQMLVINERNDKLAGARLDFKSRGMLNGSCLDGALDELAAEAGYDPNDPYQLDSDKDHEDEEMDSVNPDEGPGRDVEARIDGPGFPQEDPIDDDHTEANECGPVEGNILYNEVFLAQKKGEYYLKRRTTY